MRKTFLFILVFLLSIGNVSADFKGSASKWAEEPIAKALSIGILSADSNINYTVYTTRQEFCQFIVNLYIKDKGYHNVDEFLAKELKLSTDDYKPSFIDLDNNSSYYKYIITAKHLGFVNGKSENIFAPYNNITRQESAKILISVYQKLLDDKNILDAKEFKSDKFVDDSDIASWAKDDVYLVNHLGIMMGVGKQCFLPKELYTREQAITSLVRLHNKYSCVMKSNLDLCDEHHSDVKIKGSVQTYPDNNIEQADISKAEPSRIYLEQGYNNNNEKMKQDSSDEIKQYKAEVLELVNEERIKAGLYPLKECKVVGRYADKRAIEIISNFDHKRPDGTSCFSGLSGFKTVGENIAAGQTSPKSVVSAWMHSEHHSRNILDPSFEELAVGIAYDKDSEWEWYWVQIFYSPLH